MILLKKGVNINKTTPEMFEALIIANDVYGCCGKNITITSGSDGVHGKGSLHASGNAMDFRINNLDKDEPKWIADRLRSALGADYDVVLEKMCLHVEYQPKKKEKK